MSKTFDLLNKYIKFHAVEFKHTPSGTYFCGETDCKECKVKSECDDTGTDFYLSDVEMESLKETNPEYFI